MKSDESRELPLRPRFKLELRINVIHSQTSKRMVGKFRTEKSLVEALKQEEV